MISQNTFISVVIPVFNDQEVLNELYGRLLPAVKEISSSFEIIFIDDGSSDASWSVIEKIKVNDSHVTGIRLMRNFGQQNAIAAGLDYAGGDVVVIMDSDLQDKPEDIVLLINALEDNNVSMAIAQWKSRKDSFFKRFVSKFFYSVSQRITKIKHQPGLGVFRAIRKDVVEELKKYPEKTSTTLSLLYWIGVDYVTVELERDERFAGSSGYTIKKMMKLTFDRIFSFSMFPIRAAVYTGVTISLGSFIWAVFLVIRHYRGNVAPGWTSIIVVVLFLFGANFIFLGVIGEYLGRIFWESKQRPKYIIKKILK